MKALAIRLVTGKCLSHSSLQLLGDHDDGSTSSCHKNDTKRNNCNGTQQPQLPDHHDHHNNNDNNNDDDDKATNTSNDNTLDEEEDSSSTLALQITDSFESVELDWSHPDMSSHEEESNSDGHHHHSSSSRRKSSIKKQQQPAKEVRFSQVTVHYHSVVSLDEQGTELSLSAATTATTSTTSTTDGSTTDASTTTLQQQQQQHNNSNNHNNNPPRRRRGLGWERLATSDYPDTTMYEQRKKLHRVSPQKRLGPRILVDTVGATTTMIVADA